MKRHGLVRLSGLLTFLIVVIRTGYTQPSNLTLMSPNEEERALFGISVSGVGDVNQDGFADVVVGAVGGEQRVYIFRGPDGSVLRELMSPNEEPLGRFGHSVALGGDVNQDGFPDVLVGAWGEDPDATPPDAGRAYIFNGRDGNVLFELKSPNEEKGGRFGDSVSGAGDVNQDGFPDMYVGADKEDSGPIPDAGRGYVFSGRDGTVLFELRSPNEEEDGLFGRGASEAGDVNRDGFSDVIVGAWRESPGSSPHEAGRAYVFSGQDGSPLLELASPNEVEDGYFGYSVSAAGDVNQDGFLDAIVGAYNEAPGTSPTRAGRAYVFSGQDGSLLLQLKSPNEEENGGFGGWVSNTGDVNQDGFPDVIVGAWRERRRNGFFGTGRAYILSGQDGHLLFQLNSPNEEMGGIFGTSVADAGDFNQDGLPDVIVGAAQEDPGGSPRDAGRAYVFLTPSQTAH